MNTIDYIKFLPSDNYYYLYFLICTIIIFLYSRFRCLNLKNYKDPLKKSFYKKYKLDGWSSTHLIFYLLIGYLYPNTFLLTFIFGVIWELFETYIQIYEPTLFKNWGFCETSDGKLKKKWWYGKKSDIFVNTFGFLLGKYLSKLI